MIPETIRQMVLDGKEVVDPDTGRKLTKADLFRDKRQNRVEEKPDPVAVVSADVAKSMAGIELLAGQIAEQGKLNQRILAELQGIKVEGISRPDQPLEKVIVQTSDWDTIEFDIVRDKRGLTEKILGTKYRTEH